MKIVRISLAAIALAVLIGGQSVWADGSPWSKKETAKTTKTSKANEPSTLSKMGTGTKDFFGNLFGAKKSSAKKKTTSHSYSPYTKKPKEQKKESLLGSWFGPKETPPPKSTNEWMQLPPIRP